MLFEVRHLDLCTFSGNDNAVTLAVKIHDGEIGGHIISLHRFTLVARPWHDATQASFVLQSEAVLLLTL